MRIKARTLLLIVIAAAAPAAMAQGVRTWVSGAGLDTNPCSLTQPCRNFAAAIAAVASGGEVVALDSAGYGPVSVNKPVSIVAPLGVHAAIAPTSSPAIIIDAGFDGEVVLRNLFLNAQGSVTGVSVQSVRALHVERSVISGFAIDGILFDAGNSQAGLYVSETTFRKNGSAGIELTGQAARARAMINSSRFFQNEAAVKTFLDAGATIRNSTVSNGTMGLFAGPAGSAIFAEDCQLSHNGTGAEVGANSMITLTRCEVISNTTGIRSIGLSARVFVMDSTLAGNTTALETFGGGGIASRMDNTLQDNVVEGAFTSTFIAD